MVCMTSTGRPVLGEDRKRPIGDRWVDVNKGGEEEPAMIKVEVQLL